MSVTAHAVLDGVVEAYNRRDASAFAAFFAEDVRVVRRRGELIQHGRAAVEATYVDLFQRFPENSTRVVHRIDLGETVADHEQVRRHPAASPIDVLAIYTLQSGRIAELEFVSSQRVGEA